MGAGHVTSGGVVSTTVRENKHEALFPLASTAVHVTALSPTLNCPGDDAVTFGVHETGRVSPRSVAVTVVYADTTAKLALKRDVTLMALHSTVGGVRSTTVTGNVQLRALL